MSEYFLIQPSTSLQIGYTVLKLDSFCASPIWLHRISVNWQQFDVFHSFPLSNSPIIPHFLYPIVCLTLPLCSFFSSVTRHLPCLPPQASSLQQEKQRFISRILSGTVRFGKLQEEVKVSLFIKTSLSEYSHLPCKHFFFTQESYISGFKKSNLAHWLTLGLVCLNNVCTYD